MSDTDLQFGFLAGRYYGNQLWNFLLCFRLLCGRLLLPGSLQLAGGLL